jgi:hypothetical protein
MSPANPETHLNEICMPFVKIQFGFIQYMKNKLHARPGEISPCARWEFNQVE